MQRVTFHQPWPLLGVAPTRTLEAAVAASLPSHALMQRAGLAMTVFGSARSILTAERTALNS